jgi:hypothetical protein
LCASPSAQNKCLNARGMMPGSASMPCIVHVLPLPVWPYAKMVPGESEKGGKGGCCVARGFVFKMGGGGGSLCGASGLKNPLMQRLLRLLRVRRAPDYALWALPLKPVRVPATTSAAQVS